MKKLILICALLLMSFSAYAVVIEQRANNNYGQPFIRFINQSPYWAACYYSDKYNYLTFSVAPSSTTQWQPIYGAYVWECKYY